MKREDAAKPRALPAHVSAPVVTPVGATPVAPSPDPLQLEIPAVSHAIPKWLAAAVPLESVVANWAATNADVGKKAVWLLESLNDDDFEQVGTALALDNDDVLVLVLAALPALSAHREWSLRLIDALRAAHTSMTEDAGEGDA